MAEIQGTFEDRFEGVAQALAQNLDQGLDVGASVAVALNGEIVVDIWGGYADSAQDDALASGHARQRVLDHQDDGGAVRADPG